MYKLTNKHLETYMCVLSIGAIDALVLKNQAVSIHTADWISIVLDPYNTEVLHLLRTKLENNLHFENTT